MLSSYTYSSHYSHTMCYIKDIIGKLMWFAGKPVSGRAAVVGLLLDEHWAKLVLYEYCNNLQA